MAIIERKYRIDVSHVNKYNQLSNIGILNLLESIACMHSDMKGYGISHIEKTRLTWVLLHWKVKVFKRISYGKNVIIKTWARNLNRFATLRDFEIYDENGDKICIASSKWALIDIDSKGITKITDDIIGCYEPEEKSIFDEKDIAKLKHPELHTSPNFIFNVYRRDIDVNNHMHNTYYLSYSYEALPQELYNAPEANEFEIMYKSSAKLNNIVKCYYIHENDANWIIMKSNDDSQLHAMIKLKR